MNKLHSPRWGWPSALSSTRRTPRPASETQRERSSAQEPTLGGRGGPRLRWCGGGRPRTRPAPFNRIIVGALVLAAPRCTMGLTLAAEERRPAASTSRVPRFASVTPRYREGGHQRRARLRARGSAAVPLPRVRWGAPRVVRSRCTACRCCRSGGTCVCSQSRRRGTVRAHTMERMAVDEDRTPEEAAAVAPSEPSEPHGAPQLERRWAQLELLGQVDHPSAGACVRNTPPAAPRTPWRARASALGLRARPKIPSPQRFRDNTACVRVARVPVTHGRPDTIVPCVASASGSSFASKPYVEPHMYRSHAPVQRG